MQLRGQGSVGWTLAMAILGMFVLGVSGGDHRAGRHSDLGRRYLTGREFDRGAVGRLRVYHPLIAVAWVGSPRWPPGLQLGGGLTSG